MERASSRKQKGVPAHPTTIHRMVRHHTPYINPCQVVLWWSQQALAIPGTSCCGMLQQYPPSVLLAQAPACPSTTTPGDPVSFGTVNLTVLDWRVCFPRAVTGLAPLPGEPVIFTTFGSAYASGTGRRSQSTPHMHILVCICSNVR